MKILILSNYYPPYYIGGYEIACFDTVKYLEDLGHDIYILTGEYKDKSLKFQRIYRKLKYINYENSSIYDKYKVEMFNYKITKEVLSKINPDLVYVWSLRLVSLSPLWALEKSKINKVFEIDDFWMKGFLNKSFLAKTKRKIKELLPWFPAVKIDLSPIIIVSKWMKKEMKDLYNSKEVYCINNGTTINKIKKNKNESIIRYMYCGRIDYSKGLDLAIKALSYLKDKKISNFEFHIYGEGDNDYLNRCFNMIKILNLEENVFYHGKVTKTKKAFENNHILLMPTRMREPFGLVIIEAMNYGVIPICTNSYGPQEIISHKKDGLLFTPSSVEDLSNKILILHNKWNLLKKYRNKAYKKIEKKYDLKIAKKDLEKILINIARVKNEKYNIN